jgi:Cu2+-exporting ATPase
MLVEQGLEQFYRLKGDRTLAPVRPESLRERDYEWLEQLQAASESRCQPCDGGRASARLSVQGLSCIGCVWLVERVFSRQPGALRVQVDVLHGDVRLEWQAGEFDATAFARELQGFGYLLGTPLDHREQKRERSGLERRMGACGAFAMNAMAFSLPAYFGMPADFPFASWFGLIAAASATLALLVGGSYFVERAWKSLRAGVLHIDTPIALGILAAYAGSLLGWALKIDGLLYFDFVAMFIFLMLTGRWAQQSAVERNRRKLANDTSLPETVRLSGAPDAPDATANPVKPLLALAAGDRFWIKPGQTLPVTGKLVSLDASVSLEWINGESELQHRREGQMLPAGVLNAGLRELEVEALQGWEDSTLRRLLEARKNGEMRDHALERLLRWYLAVVVVLGFAGAVWWWLAGEGIGRALQVMISVFVVSCPCALGVAAPLAEELASSRAERLGVFVRQLAFWKRLLRVRQVVFDKTGTLTLENPVLVDPDKLALLPSEAKAALRRLVTGNLHPVSRSLFDALGPGEMAEGAVEEVVGDGLRLLSEAGGEWFLGRPGLWAMVPGQEAVVGNADVVLSRDGVPQAGFSFEERLRRDSVVEVQSLRQEGLRVCILSGDRESKVEPVAAQLGLARDDWSAGLTPADKAAWVAGHNPEHTLFVGDGANDSLAFDVALCAGSPITGRSFLEQKADFFFLGNSLRFPSALRAVARLHRRAVRRVFGFSVLYNIGAAALGLVGHLNPLLAAILMPLSSLVTLSLVAWTFRRSVASDPALESPLPVGATAQAM